MKIYYLLIFVSLFCISVSAQIDTTGKVNFSNLDKKLIFIELQAPSYKELSNSEVSRFSPLANKETADFLRENFICFRSIVGDDPKLTSFLANKGQRSTLPKYYVFDSDSNFLASDFGTLSKVSDFETLRDSAVKKAEEFRRLKTYATKFADSTITKQELKHFIEFKLALKRYDNAELIERFATQMTDEDSQDADIILLILKAGPYFSSLAYNKARRDTALYNRIYKEQFCNYSPNFFQRAFKNSMANATEHKDFLMAQTVAQFIQYRYHRSEYKTEMYNSRVLMDYCKSVKDTVTFLKYLSKTYNAYLLITPDSSQRYETKILDRLMAKKAEDKEGNVRNTATAPKYYFASQLSYGASQISNAKTKDPNYLNKGIDYCRHALLLAPSYYRAKATLSKLLYRSGFYNEAEKIQREVINISGLPASAKLFYSAGLEKIINRTME